MKPQRTHAWAGAILAELAGLCLVLLTGLAGCVPFDIGTAPLPEDPKSVNATDALALIQRRQGAPNFIIIDVRTAEEFATGHIVNAINICVTCTAQFRSTIAGLDRSHTYLVYCGSQHRSPTAIQIMREEGFTGLYELIDGLAAWQAAGFPTVQ
jgi:rhodanese-related sulfurtransferase